jgi:hypothetical protein
MAAIVRNAEQDADDVIAFLKKLGLPQPAAGDEPLRLPAAFLLGLGIALRMTLWEVRGIRVHLDAGLPNAQVVRRTACADPSAPVDDAFVASLWNRVLDLTLRRFAWQGPEIVSADVLVGNVDEDLLVEAFARFVWERRHAGKRPADDGAQAQDNPRS